MSTKAPRKLGRPPATDSADTRRRVIEVAREAFAQQGWEVTTNKHVAAKAGITSAALYHYFDSKLDMYLAVFDDVETFVDARFDEAVAASDTFVGRFRAVLEAAYALNAADPSLARFLGSARVDIGRHGELQAAIEQHRRPGAEIVQRLVDGGIATGEIPRERQSEAASFVRTVLVGLNDAVSHDLREQRAAIDGVLGALEGRLLNAGKASTASKVGKANPARKTSTPRKASRAANATRARGR